MRASKVHPDKNRRRKAHMRSTGVQQQKVRADVGERDTDSSGELPVEFIVRLRKRSCGTFSYSDFVATAGEFVTVRNGRVDEDDPCTRIARKVLRLLSISGKTPTAIVDSDKKRATAR